MAKRVKEIADSWPAIWGPKKLSDIAVLSSYRYQVKLELVFKPSCKWNYIFLQTDVDVTYPTRCNGSRF